MKNTTKNTTKVKAVVLNLYTMETEEVITDRDGLGGIILQGCFDVLSCEDVEG